MAVGATHFRRHAASHLLAFRPSVLRGNASEILALGGAEPSGGQGTDSGDSAESALPTARALSRTTPTVVVATGARDVATDGETVVRVGNGNALMTRVTAVGCALTATVSPRLAAWNRRFGWCRARFRDLGVKRSLVRIQSPRIT